MMPYYRARYSTEAAEFRSPQGHEWAFIVHRLDWHHRGMMYHLTFAEDASLSVLCKGDVARYIRNTLARQFWQWRQAHGIKRNERSA
jgi:hypothetical protein